MEALSQLYHSIASISYHKGCALHVLLVLLGRASDPEFAAKSGLGIRDLGDYDLPPAMLFAPAISPMIIILRLVWEKSWH